MKICFRNYLLASITLFIFSSSLFARGEFCNTPGACISADECTSGLVNNIDYEKEFAERLCEFKTEFEQWDIIRKKGYIEHVVEQTPYYAQEIYYMSAVHALLFAYNEMDLIKATRFDKCVRKFHDDTGISILRSHDNCEILALHWPIAKEDELLKCTIEREQTQNESPDDAFNSCIDQVFPQI